LGLDRRYGHLQKITPGRKMADSVHLSARHLSAAQFLVAETTIVWAIHKAMANVRYQLTTGK
jgi:hypothetical protein